VRVTEVVDQGLPAVQFLLGPRAEEAARVAVAEDGASVLSVRPRQVLYRPGRRISVRYEASVVWPAGAARTEEIVVMARREGLPEGYPRGEVAGVQVAAWRYPHDPELTHLASVTRPEVASELLAQAIDLPASARVEVVPAAYRPRGRAVLEVRATTGAKKLVVGPGGALREQAPPPRRLFLKVLPEDEARELETLHRRIGERIRVAEARSAPSYPGVVVLEALPGETLRDRLRHGERPPAPVELLALLDSVAAVDLEGEPAKTAHERAGNYAELLSAILPDQAERIDRLRAGVGEGVDEPRVTIHGDFHESQVLVDDGGVCGLLDVDDAGPGQRIDDLALMAGRLWSFARVRADDAIVRYAEEVIEECRATADREELDRRVVSVLLGRATGPFRNQLDDWREATLRRLEIAEDWLRRSSA
jgi:aminoglycoside phosphotransferase (APT) family kinase protein